MKQLFTAFALVLTLIIVPSIFAQVGVIQEEKLLAETLISDPIKPAKTLLELESQSLKNTMRLVMNHSVSIVGLGSGFTTCSGVLIKNTLEESIILTAKHCIGTVEELYVENILADSVGISFYDDLAYIKLNEMIINKTPATISEFTPVKGDLVIAVGYPSLKLHVALGEISVRTKDWQFARIHIIPGCSGSGAYNEYGELIGIVWGAINGKDENEDDSEIGIFERLQDVVRFVKKNKLLE